MKPNLLFKLVFLSLLFIGISCSPDDDACQEEPEVCACLNNPLRCVSPVGTNEIPSESDNAESKLPVGKE
tara:strand:+ start:172 stop:381 length:210 start_codon:yes stop_codon:yes gene_type:complete